jgi:hypothetical protein
VDKTSLVTMSSETESREETVPIEGPTGGAEATTTYRPTKPTMGGVQKQSDNSYIAYTGGKPQAGWFGPDEPNPKLIMATQCRPTSNGAATKGMHYRTLGVEPKFTRISDLLTFQKKISDHLVRHGMDTITYLTDPTDSTKVVSILGEHDQFTLKEAKDIEEKDQSSSYDQYDESNIRDSKTFLLNSLDETVLTQMYENCDDTETFIVHWMNLMLIVGSISIERFDKIKDSIKKRKMQDYSGEDVEAISTDYMSGWKNLHGARMYDHSLTLTMLKTIMQSGNEDFRYGLRSLKEKLNKKLLEIRHLSYDDSHKSMIQAELDVQSVLKQCKQEYRILLDDGKWPAAAHARDSKAIGRSYGSTNTVFADTLSATKLNRIIANALQRVVGGGARDKSQDKCRFCGEKGHWAQECPKKNKGSVRTPNNNNRFNTRPPDRNNGGRNGERIRKQRFPPPRPGEGEIKTVEGKKFYWCTKCNNWTVSHGTATHKTREELRATMTNDRPRDNRYDFDVQPSAFAITSCPTAFRLNATIDKQNRMILFDSGANCCISNDKSDFIVGQYHKFAVGKSVEGVGKTLRADGIGQLHWTFTAEDGSHRTLELPAYYIPSVNQKIASTSQVLKKYPNDHIDISSTQLRLIGAGTNQSITVPLCPRTELPLGQARSLCGALGEVLAVTTGPLAKIRTTPSLTEGANFNLTAPEKELLRWHYRLGHVSIRRIQWMFQRGYLANTEQSKRAQAAAAKLDSGPLCTACQYAKQRRKTSPGSTKRTTQSESGQLKQDRMFPGQQVSVDHFHSKPYGRRLNTYGKEADDKKYTGGCIFVDHSSGYVHVELQSHLNSHETLKAKEQFEAMCSTTGIVIQEYLSDNGTAFVNKDFDAHLKQFHQTIRHSGVGAHHSNGLAERAIATVMSISRAMLHHAAIHWPDVADVELWPLTVLHAVYLLNRIPHQDSGQSALELFTRTIWPKAKFQDFHTWGAPAYVLDDTLADGKKLPRWKPRSGRHVYVGSGAVGSAHSHSIPLVLSLDTGKITPQYHVVFDDWFNTVSSTDAAQINFEHDDWYRTFGLTEYQYVVDDDAPMAYPPLQQRETADRREDLLRVRESNLPPMVPLPAIIEPTPAVPAVPPPLAPIHAEPPQPEPTPVIPFVVPSPIMKPPSAPPSSSQREMIPATMVPTTRPTPRQLDAPRPPTLRRSPRHSMEPTRRSQRIQERTAATWVPITRPELMDKSALYDKRSEVSLSTDQLMNTPLDCLDALIPKGSLIPSGPMPGTLIPSGPMLDPLMAFWSHAFSSTIDSAKEVRRGKPKSKPDTFSWDEAMRLPDKDLWLEAADIEIRALESHSAWREDLKSNATNRIVPSQWVFTYKRNPDGTIKKRKARIVLRGDLQDYEGETYSPVAAWSTVRAFLVTSAVLDRATCTIDFSNAFIQSPLPSDQAVWMHTPRGYATRGGFAYCLNLLKSLYGHKISSLLWFKHCGKHFRKLGLIQSEYDPCLWYGRDIMLVQYVDDCGISAPTQADIDKFVLDLRNEGLLLTKEDSFSEFLGIKFEVKDGVHIMTQKGLIQKILDTANMNDCNPNSVPATLTALGADKEGKPMTDTWNYRAIVGMLLYLSNNTRGDIAFAVSQVARFSNEPKQSHATAIKTILRYLKKTFDRGTEVTPSKTFDLQLYVDADFGGLFGQEDDRNPDSVRSRTGYIIKLANWPILYKSVLQTNLSQSTLEAEYTALSFALRTLLPFKWLLEEMISWLNGEGHGVASTTILATVFEDNQSAFYLATNHRITNRTRYLLSKWHWFWALYDQGDQFVIEKCASDRMQADYCTKSLPKDAFEANRKAVIGW